MTGQKFCTKGFHKAGHGGGEGGEVREGGTAEEGRPHVWLGFRNQLWIQDACLCQEDLFKKEQSMLFLRIVAD